jgi:hypothetical protein
MAPKGPVLVVGGVRLCRRCANGSPGYFRDPFAYEQVYNWRSGYHHLLREPQGDYTVCGQNANAPNWDYGEREDDDWEV